MKTSSKDTMKAPRTVARVFSAIIIAFALIMFVGEAIESKKKGTSEPMTIYVVTQLALFGISLLGLALAWKWEMFGGVISLIAIIIVFIVNQEALVGPMFIFPANAILFIVVAYQSKALNLKTK
jgi:hypothetical protein